MIALLERLANFFAYVGGALIIAIMLMATGSVASRAVLGKAFLGDVELTQYGMGIAVACFLPICQLRLGHIIVDFFTASARDATRLTLDRLGALSMALLMGVLAWRTGAGAVSQYASSITTMQMQWPEWYAYAAMVLPIGLAALIALYMAATGRGFDKQPAPA